MPPDAADLSDGEAVPALRRGNPAWTGMLARGIEIWRREAHVQFSLGACPWIRAAAGPTGTAGVEWTGPIAIDGLARLALATTAPASIVYRLPVAPRSSVRSVVALAPEWWERCRGGVTFRLHAATLDGRLARACAQHVNPARRPEHRTWVPVEASLGAFAGEEIDLTLSAEAAGDAGGVGVFWGEPTVAVRRGLGEIGALARAYVALFGARDAFLKLLELVQRSPAAAASDYRRWMADHEAATAGAVRALPAQPRLPGGRPVVSLLLSTSRAAADLVPKSVDSLRLQSDGRWELCVAGEALDLPHVRGLLERRAQEDGRIRLSPGGVSECGAWNDALSTAGADYVATMAAGDELAPHAVQALARLLDRQPEADVIYSDEDRIAPGGGRSEPFFKPAWSPDYLLSTAYVGRLCAVRRTLVEASGGYRPAFATAQEYDLLLRVSERTARIHHIEEVLCHVWEPSPEPVVDRAPRADRHRAVAEALARREVDARVEDTAHPGIVRIRYRVAATPLISIVIPTAGRERTVGTRRMDLLVNCIRSIVERTQYPQYEIVYVDNADLRPATRDALDRIGDSRIRGVSYTGAVNLARKMNLGARHARGTHLVFLNDDTEVISPAWLTDMVGLSQQPRVGAVGVKLRFPSGAIQHGGMVIEERLPRIVFRGYPQDHTGYFGNLVADCNYGSVIGACVMTRAVLFADVGGFHEGMPYLWHDIEYCFKVRQRNCDIVFTPHVELFHLETASRPPVFRSRDTVLMARLWRAQLAHDPFYNRNFRQDQADFRLHA